ncbi:DUF4331 domain-containing protein [Actinoplanes sp. TBRC 11911]|uniref:DUF4331 family protein n=1 Tax=Actinoplanes sp. TBRC 11911 TaxID=2729386 RepID=UPI00145DF57E|nr:DUF4331 family protein [Actinoplanes sp. TBRC 11911]NMO55417.1 DUF4331 domain-containing protein [Actinoplanes sp. TBRC 11911]
MLYEPDSPVTRDDTRLNIADLYVFRGEEGTVFVMNVNHSFFADVTGKQSPAGYHPEARYEFRLDTDGDARENVVYRFTFGELDNSGRQALTLQALYDTASALSHAETENVTILEGVTGQTVTAPSGTRVWTGRAGDPSWIDTGDLSAAERPFARQSVYTIVLEVPDDELQPMLADDQRFTVWALTSLVTGVDGWQPVKRVGFPMIHPLFAEFDEQWGEELNHTPPADDTVNYGKQLASAIAALVAAYGNVLDPQAYGAAFAARFLPDVLPYTLGTQAVYGFLEINGRSLIDNAPNVMFSMATNTPVLIGLDNSTMTAAFPYFREPS